MIHDTMTAVGEVIAILAPLSVSPNDYLYCPDAHARAVDIFKATASAVVDSAFMTGNDAIWIMVKLNGICDAGDISINFPASMRNLKGTNVRCYLVSRHPDYQVAGTAYMTLVVYHNNYKHTQHF